MKITKRWLVATAVLSVAMVQAHAGIVIFTDRSAFLAALAQPYDETFQSVPLGDVSSPAFFHGPGFNFFFTVSAPNGLVVSTIGTDEYLGVKSGSDALSFSLLGEKSIGGSFFFDDGNGAIATGAAGTLTLANTLFGDIVLNVTAPTATTGFFGFISSLQLGPMATLTFARTTGPGTGFADTGEIIVGTALPEPGTTAMMAAGLVSLLAIRRKRRS